jgi:hypothetical protein
VDRAQLVEQHLQEHLAASGEPEPAWARCPWLECGSIGWRMGYGEGWLELVGHYLCTRLHGPAEMLAYLHRHPPAPRTWHDAVVGMLALAEGSDGDDPDVAARLGAQVLAEGLTADDAAYPVYVRNELVGGALPAPWTSDRLPQLRHGARTLGFWARWVAQAGRDRAAYLAGQPPAPRRWRHVSEAVRTGDPGRPWARLRDRVGLVVALAATGTIPPPWSAGHPALARVSYDDGADARHAWAWWLHSVFDDRASLAAYLAALPPPPDWDRALREEIIPWLLPQ